MLKQWKRGRPGVAVCHLLLVAMTACAETGTEPNLLGTLLLPAAARGTALLAVLNVTEGGATDTYAIALDQAPSATVTVQIQPDSQVTVSTTSLSFNSGNWSTPQGVIVTAVDDTIIEGNHNGSITHSIVTADPLFENLVIGQVRVAIVDNDSAGVSVAPTAVAATEGGANGSYAIVLSFGPAANVTITATADAQSRVNGGATAVLTFTAGACPGPGNWCVAQNVTVSAFNDTIVEGGHSSTITHAAVSADPNYNGIGIANVTATLTDNDAAGVSIVQSGGTTNIVEGGATDGITVVLTTEPTSNVTVRMTPDGQSSLGAGAGVAVDLVFTAGSCPGPGDWCTPQALTVTANDDAADEGNHTSTITRTVTAGPAPYTALAAANFMASIVDNDRASVTINTSGTVDVDELTPAVTDSYTIVLGYQPQNDVVIRVDPDTQVSVNGAAAGAPVDLTFTGGAACPPQNWCTAQTVTVAAEDDIVGEGTPHTGTITHTVQAGSPAAYLALNPLPNVSVNITDDDSEGIIVTQSGGTTTVSEAGATDSYTVRLTSDPGIGVTVNVDPDGQLNLGAGVDTAINLNFTAGACPGVGDWCVNQTVNVSANDDGASEGNHNGTIVHAVTAGPAGYTALAPINVSVAITDNDVKRIFVSAGAWMGNAVGGIAGADAKCAADANKPAGGVWRALIVESNGVPSRIASVSPDAGDGQVSWVLSANQAYYRTDLTTALFTTDANSLFVFGTLTNAIGAGAVWTGLNANWTARGALEECGEWASAGPIIFGGIGNSGATGSTSISNGTAACDAGTRRLICVEQ